MIRASRRLTVSASAADPALVPPGNITFGGSGANRWLRIMPAPDKFGGTTITYGVSDGETTTERSFPFSFISRNDAPTVTPIADVTIASGESTTVEFTIADVDDPLTGLNVVVQSDNFTLISNADLKVTEIAGDSHSLTLTPRNGQTGTAMITVTAVDPHGTAGRIAFKLTVGAAVAQLDFGDAPAVYPVLLAANGARHTVKLDQARVFPGCGRGRGSRWSAQRKCRRRRS